MGIDYDGGMIVGIHAENIDEKLYGEDTEFKGDLYEWVEHNGLEAYAPYYDCPMEERTIGYCPTNFVPLGDVDEWSKEVKLLFIKLENLTDIKPKLIGMQNIW